MDLHEKEDAIRFVYNLETCGGPGDIEESLSMREGSRGTVAWIQQKASIASVFTPDLQQCIVVGCNGAEVKILPLIILSQWCSCYLVSKIQCMGSPRYCFAAVRADILARRSTVTFLRKNDVIGKNSLLKMTPHKIK